MSRKCLAKGCDRVLSDSNHGLVCYSCEEKNSPQDVYVRILVNGEVHASPRKDTEDEAHEVARVIKTQVPLDKYVQWKWIKNHNDELPEELYDLWQLIEDTIPTAVATALKKEQ